MEDVAYLENLEKVRLYLLGIVPVGEAVLKEEKTTYEGRAAVHLSAVAYTGGFFSRIIAARVAADSFVDSQSLNPMEFRQKTAIRGKETEKKVVYDQEKKVMIIAGKSWDILENTKDPLSAVYTMRHMKFAPSQPIEMNINTNQKNYSVKGWCNFIHEEINGTAYQVTQINVSIQRRDKNNPYHRSKVEIFALEGRANTPVLIKVLSGGVLAYARLINTR